VGGKPKLADIGLVAGVGDTLSFVGTEGFIPPEGPGTAQADIYGLGKLLYELAVGLDRLEFPQLPPVLLVGKEGDELLELNEVITRACEPDARRRYADAAEMDGDLKLFLAGRSLREARKFQRHLVQLKRVALVACGLLFITVIFLWIAKMRERESLERVRVETALRQRAEAAELRARQELYGASLGEARATVRSGELGQRLNTLAAVHRVAAITNTLELRREAFAALSLPDLRREREIPLSPGVTAATLDFAFERVAICRGIGSVEIRKAIDGRLLTTLAASTNITAYAAQWSWNGHYLLVKRYEHRQSDFADFEVWNVDAGRRVLTLHDVPVDAADFHRSQPWFVAQTATNCAVIWNLADGSEISHIDLEGRPFHLRFAPDGARLLAIYRVGPGWKAAVHELATGRMVSSAIFAERISALDWDSRERWIAVADRVGRVYLMEPQAGKTSLLAQHRTEVVTTAFSPDGDYLFSAVMRRRWSAPICAAASRR